MDYDIRGANQQFADIGKVIFACIAIQQMSADDIGLAMIHCDQAVQTACIRTERAGGREAAFQVAGQNIQRHILSGNDHVHSRSFTGISRRLGEMKRHRECGWRQHVRGGRLQG
ncbi:hypothetical protein D3C80_1821510 [compost metagenome]